MLMILNHFIFTEKSRDIIDLTSEKSSDIKPIASEKGVSGGHQPNNNDDAQIG